MALECEFGRYCPRTIDAIQQLYKARDIRRMVEEEIDWFTESYRMPASISLYPSRVHLNNFRSKIHNHVYTEVIEIYETSPQELSQLCSKRLLSGDHMRYISKKVNRQQNEYICAYANSVHNVERYVNRNTVGGIVKNKLVLILHVGKKKILRNGKSEWSVFLSNINNRGCHFAVAFIDFDLHTILYGDSLGWSSPDQLPEIVKTFYQSKKFKEKKNW